MNEIYNFIFVIAIRSDSPTLAVFTERVITTLYQTCLGVENWLIDLGPRVLSVSRLSLSVTKKCSEYLVSLSIILILGKHLAEKFV